MSFSLIDIWNHMGFTARGVNFVLLLMSIYSLSVMIERYMTFRKAKKQSRAYAPRVAKLLKDGKIQDAIKSSSTKDVKNSHLAKVLLAGLQEYQYQKESGEGTRSDMMEAAHRAIERATALNLTDLKRGLSGLATVGATAVFVGLFGTVAGIINAFRGMALTGSGGIGAVSAGIAEALVATAFGLFVAIPAVWAFNYLIARVEGFTVEMDNSASELIDYMAKKTASH
ncbi:MAG: protein TolQ [Acidobacteriota bacterium]|nr:MAG: protein TolQ [Acidobacteriota bacterium]